jgi:Tfp pilus assembly protein PilN
MRVPVNLARHPFRRDRPVLVASSVVAVLLLGTLIMLVVLAINERNAARETREALTQVNRRLTSISTEQATLNRQLRKPGNEVVLDRSILLNTLIQRKAISWTRIFSDLGTVLPENVRVIAIRPQVNGQDQLFLDMTVSATSPEPVIAFIVKLESSDAFGSTAVSGIVSPSQTDPTYRYRLSVNYAQKL